MTTISLRACLFIISLAAIAVNAAPLTKKGVLKSEAIDRPTHGKHRPLHPTPTETPSPSSTAPLTK